MILQYAYLQVVTGLYENSSYQFRVCAQNAAGAGLFSCPSDPIPCEDPIGIPAIPSSFRVHDSTKTSVTLKWDAPWYDGGDHRVSYVVEQEMDDDSWAIRCEKRMDEFECCIEPLSEGKTYNFRIKTVNKAGESKTVEIEGIPKERIGESIIHGNIKHNDVSELYHTLRSLQRLYTLLALQGTRLLYVSMIYV